MSECVLNDGFIVSDYGRPYIVAEVNSSHKGDMDVAKQMIDAAADSGCDCVKFQSWSAQSLYCKSYYDSNPVSKKIIQKVSLSPDELLDLSRYCRKRGVSFSSTAYSKEEVDFLVEECNAPYIKIASMEINNIEFLRYIGKKNMPIVLSTGMSEMPEIEKAVDTLEDSGAEKIVILHCISIYPTILPSVNLNNIIGLRERFSKYPIGFSDHTEGDAASVAAVALGAGFLEKHFTLDKSKVGMDNAMATEPDEFMRLIQKCRDVQVAMGCKERSVSTEELSQREKMRRSVVSAVHIEKGHRIAEADLDAKRPGTGIPPDKIHEIIGKVAIRDIESDTMIKDEDLQ